MRPILFLSVVIVLAGCRSYEGVYQPDCIAHAGDTVSLKAGRFEWHKFTDEVIVDDTGRRVDPFPDYPRAGTYEIDGDLVIFTDEDGEPLARMILHDQEERFFLLTGVQYEHWRQSAELAACALVLGGYAASQENP